MEAFLNPSSVVLIGVSRQSGVGAYNNLETMLRYGYQGRIYVVHPKVRSILGRDTHPTVRELPEVPDLAIISVGRDRVLPVFTECVQKGIGHVIIISQGFADADAAGKELQTEIVQTARAHGVRVMGPNTMGVLNAFAGFSTAFIDLPRDPAPPPLSLVAQSGVLQVGIESFTGRLGKAIDIGNGCDVHFVDLLRYLEQDPETEIIVLHMEGMNHGREFLRLADRISRKKPIVAFKTGRSEAGARAALSHTGSLVGEDPVFDAAFEKVGIIRVRDTVELRSVSKAFIHGLCMQGPNLAVVTATGACGIMTADACEAYGLRLAPFPESARSSLENPRIAWHHLSNPVDLWPLGMVSGSFTEMVERTCTLLFDSPNVHAVLVIAPVMASPLHENLHLRDTVIRIQEKNAHRKPLALWVYGDGAAEEARELDKIPGVACFSSLEEAVMGLSGTYRFHRFRKRPEIPWEEPHRGSQLPVLSSFEPPRTKEILLGEQAEELLDAYGISTAPSHTTLDADDAVRWAEKIGYPVVMKIVSPQWVHKTELGGVVTGLRDEKEIRNAFQSLRQRFFDTTPSGRLEGIQLQKQMEGKELLLGIKRDPQFGPVIIVGMGGIYTEVFRDVARGIAPLSPQEAENLLRSLRMFPLLQGVRGEPPVALDAVVKMMVRLSRLALDHPEIAELDLNPVFANDQDCSSADCRVVLDSVK